MKRLRAIQFEGIPSIKNGCCVPFFDIYDCQGMIVNKMFSFPNTTVYKRGKDTTAHFTLC